MSVLREQKQAIESAVLFLEDLLDPYKTPRVPKCIRDRAERVLRHYPVSMSEIDNLFKPLFEKGVTSL
jgi:hypothetical protein